ncbi:hypothetical protein BN14_12408 [Rhizoctonia solani AG-1 IB]|uniref:Uncharacterized protein n=1 Tax=Thanatephorus cucumeris (strain AG1-IB / isolate 7/3/14) TaxID=1108050 RepID=M5CFS5_THACB|nr:hypothetical protein BN14_12408 [Rhizoctonia solani AG-1 IB]
MFALGLGTGNGRTVLVEVVVAASETWEWDGGSAGSGRIAGFVAMEDTDVDDPVRESELGGDSVAVEEEPGTAGNARTDMLNRP